VQYNVYCDLLVKSASLSVRIGDIGRDTPGVDCRFRAEEYAGACCFLVTMMMPEPRALEERYGQVGVNPVASSAS
jgi:hypothetical protein